MHVSSEKKKYTVRRLRYPTQLTTLHHYSGDGLILYLNKQLHISKLSALVSLLHCYVNLVEINHSPCNINSEITGRNVLYEPL